MIRYSIAKPVGELLVIEVSIVFVDRLYYVIINKFLASCSDEN